MTYYDHEAVRKAYPEVVSIRDGSNNPGAFLEDGTPVTLDQAKVDAARVELDKLNYRDTRRRLYPTLGDFADAMYWNSKGDSSKLTEYYAACEKVKTDNPKPE